ncbi:MAG: hypothetical protein HOC71_03835 [Candidatus Latescibacteria bacterium]|jgi:hypothetical protein|nr:hypothetical protein [Candidatus Latescibacterota bacterium]
MSNLDEITVFSTWDEPMADMAVGLLLAEEIYAYKRGSGLRSTIAITVDGLGEIGVCVSEKDRKRAVEILAVRFSEGIITEPEDSADE